MQAEKHWGILGVLDGYGHQPEKMAQIRMEAMRDLQGQDLEELWFLVVNMGMLMSGRNAQTGYELGHTIIFQNVAQDPASIFHEGYQAAPQSFKDRLNKGRFWECLPQLRVREEFIGGTPKENLHVEDVLLNHPNALDVTFVPFGLNLMYRSAGSPRPRIDIRTLSNDAVWSFREFLGRIDEASMGLQTDSSRLSPLFEGYVDFLLEHDRDGVPRFYDGVERLDRDDLVRKYLPKSKLDEHVEEWERIEAQFTH